MDKKAKSFLGAAAKFVLVAALKALLFAFWVASNCAVVLLQKLNDNIKEYLFDKE